MSRQCIAACADWLQQNTRLPAAQRAALAGLGPALVERISAVGTDPCFIGVAGAPGTGKSTLCGMLGAALASEDQAALTLSLDDYYLAAAQRTRLGEEVHELFAKRGVPGTHDTGLLLEHIDALRTGFDGRLLLPRFNKSTDDRMALPSIVNVPDKLRVVFVEGWVIGAPPQATEALTTAVNDLESEHDGDGQWRAKVNDHLARMTAALLTRLDARWYLRDPGWSAVLGWRWHQECDLPETQRLLADDAAVADFLAPFQRLCEHLGATDWADLVVELDEQHQPEIIPAP